MTAHGTEIIGTNVVIGTLEKTQQINWNYFLLTLLLSVALVKEIVTIMANLMKMGAV